MIDSGLTVADLPELRMTLFAYPLTLATHVPLPNSMLTLIARPQLFFPPEDLLKSSIHKIQGKKLTDLITQYLGDLVRCEVIAANLVRALTK